MDSLSSADLDTTSKTPMFIGIAAIIIGIVGSLLGWMGFSKASALEAELSRVSETAAAMEDLKAKLDQASNDAKSSAAEVDSLKATLNKMSQAISKDVSGVKKDMRALTIQVGTAVKKFNALEPGAVAPAKTTTSPKTTTQTSGKPGATIRETSTAPSGTETYKIQKGDMLYRVAAKFGVTVPAIEAANPGLNPNRLQIGQEIVIPKK